MQKCLKCGERTRYFDFWRSLRKPITCRSCGSRHTICEYIYMVFVAHLFGFGLLVFGASLINILALVDGGKPLAIGEYNEPLIWFFYVAILLGAPFLARYKLKDE